MAMIEIKTPTDGELKYAGLMITAVFFVVGGVVYWRTGLQSAAFIILGIGAFISLFYYLIPASHLFIYYGWMKLVSPIGWLVSHAIFAVTYFLILTPIGLLMRLFRYDPMTRRLESDAKSYWTRHSTGKNHERYFNQY
jgi:hypothetical protein